MSVTQIDDFNPLGKYKDVKSKKTWKDYLRYYLIIGGVYVIVFLISDILGISKNPVLLGKTVSEVIYQVIAVVLLWLPAMVVAIITFSSEGLSSTAILGVIIFLAPIIITVIGFLLYLIRAKNQQQKLGKEIIASYAENLGLDNISDEDDLLKHWEQELDIDDVVAKVQHMNYIQTIKDAQTPVEVDDILQQGRPKRKIIHDKIADLQKMSVLFDSFLNRPVEEREASGISGKEIFALQQKFQNNFRDLSNIESAIQNTFNKKREFFKPWEKLLDLIDNSRDGAEVGIDRLAELLEIPKKEAEEFLTHFLKMNEGIGEFHRLEGVFKKASAAQERLSTLKQDFQDYDTSHVGKLNKQINVFVSYAVVDANRFHIQQFVELLKAKEYINDVFFWATTSSGSIVEYMQEHVKKAESVIFFYSDAAANSGAIKRERDMAIYQGKHCIPVFEEIKHVPEIMQVDTGVPIDNKSPQEICDRVYDLIQLYHGS